MTAQPASYSIQWPADHTGGWASRYAKAAQDVMAQGGVEMGRVAAMQRAVNDHALFDTLNDREKIIVRILRLGQRLEATLLALTEAQVAIDDPSGFLRVFNDDLGRLQALLVSVRNTNNARSGMHPEGEPILEGPTKQGEVDALEEVMSTVYHRSSLRDGMWLFSPNTPKEWKIRGADSPMVDVNSVKKVSTPPSLFFNHPPAYDYNKDRS